MVARRLAGLLVLALTLGACGGPDGAGPTAMTGSPVGLWTLDTAALLASVAERYRAEGPDVVAREQAQARLVALDLQVREDGKFGLRSSALGLSQHIVGVWRADGPLLQFFHLTVDGKPAETETREDATFDGRRIVLPFEQTGLDFVLIRR